MLNNHPRIVALWVVDCFEYVGEHPGLAMARAFAEGAQTGGGYFGSGVTAVVLPDDRAELEEMLEDKYIERGEWERVAKTLPAWAVPQSSTEKDGG